MPERAFLVQNAAFVLRSGRSIGGPGSQEAATLVNLARGMRNGQSQLINCVRKHRDHFQHPRRLCQISCFEKGLRVIQAILWHIWQCAHEHLVGAACRLVVALMEVAVPQERQRSSIAWQHLHTRASVACHASSCAAGGGRSSTRRMHTARARACQIRRPHLHYGLEQLDGFAVVPFFDESVNLPGVLALLHRRHDCKRSNLGYSKRSERCVSTAWGYIKDDRGQEEVSRTEAAANRCSCTEVVKDTA